MDGNMDSSLNGGAGKIRRGSRQTVLRKPYQEMMTKSTLASSRVDEALHAVVENKLSKRALSESNNSVLERNRALLQYVATLAGSNKRYDEFNYEFVISLVNGGADINVTDQHGQSLFHEVARSWNTDVAQFLLELGGDIDKQDDFGRTPLHVAVSVDFVEMTEFLLLKGANIDARTLTEFQAPIHYAAKNGCNDSLAVLLGYGANIDSFDHRQRSPLQLAAQWSRDKTAKTLIDEGASSWVLDSSGNSALSVLIDRLPHLALEALNQLHTRDLLTMEDKFHLNLLETSRLKIETKKIRTPLETAVTTRKYEVVTHPVMQRLIQNKWMKFARLTTMLDLCFYIVFNIMWMAMSMLTPETGYELYQPLNEKAWRIVLLIVIGVMIVYQVWHQITVTRKTVTAQKHWIQWKTSELQDDLKFCHPRWPQEEKAVQYEIKRVAKLATFSGTDAWFYYDWLVLILMIAAIISHILYNQLDTYVSKAVYTKIASVVNLVVSLRLLESVRPFPGIGTLVIILGETAGDFLNWGFLFLLLFVPFSAAFWIIFGGVSLKPVHGYRYTKDVLYSTFRMAVGDDFNIEGLIEADPVMSRILTVLYITVMTIVTLNLLIALLSDTFTRVHSNAVANTIMQRAIKVIEAERTLSKKKKQIYREHIQTNCSPEIIATVIDTNPSNNTLEAAEVHRNLSTIKTVLDDRFGAVYGKGKSSDFDKVRQDIKKLDGLQKTLHQNLEVIVNCMKKLQGKKGKKTQKSQEVTFPPEENEEKPGLAILLRSKLTSFFDRDETGEQHKNRRRGRKKRSSRHRQSRDRADNSGRSTSIVAYNPRAGTLNRGYSQDSQFDGGDKGWDKVSLSSLDL